MGSKCQGKWEINAKGDENVLKLNILKAIDLHTLNG